LLDISNLFEIIDLSNAEDGHAVSSKVSFWMALWDSVSHCWRETVAEGIGTFILVFAGTGAVMVNQISDGAVTHLVSTLCLGL